MNIYKKKSAFLLSAFLIATSHGIFSQQIVLESSLGDSYVMDIEPNQPFKEVVNSISECLTIAESRSAETMGVDTYESMMNAGQFKMLVANNSIVVKPLSKAQEIARNYNVAPTAQQKTDISYIVNTLSNASLLKVASAESSLKKAGERIDSVHPLQFLIYVFNQEELKVSMRNLQGRSWVWKEFLEGITKTLTKENAAGRVQPYMQDFAKKVGLDVSVIKPSFQNGKWEKLIDILIKNVPRKGETGRYGL